ncbi:MAG: hypothetical protein ACMG6S_16870 [Byssovorax sp.]
MQRSLAPLLTSFLTLSLLASCGGTGEQGTGGPGSGGSAGSSTVGSGGSSGSGVPPGPGDGNWRKAFSKDGVGVSCEATYAEMTASGAPSLTSGKTTIFVGFQQYSNNQDPVFFRFDDEKKVYCEHHEHESPDARALGITWDGGPKAYVVYTVTGGGTAFDSLAKGAWIDRYGDGGGSSKVAVVASVETAFGTVERATFVPAKRESGTKTNTLAPADAITVRTDGALEFTGNSAFAPLNPDKSVMCVPSTEYPAALDGMKGPSYLARFAPDLKTMSCASTAGCSLVTTPCP